MKKQKYTARSTAKTVAELLNKYKAGELTEQEARQKLEWMLCFRKNSIYKDAIRRVYKVTFIQILRKKKLQLFEQLIEKRGEVK